MDDNAYCTEVVNYVFSDKFDIFNFTDNIFEHKFKFLVCIFYGLDFISTPCLEYIIEPIESYIVNEDNCISIFKSFINIFGESPPLFNKLNELVIKNKNFEPSMVENVKHPFFKGFNIINKDKSKLFKSNHIFMLPLSVIDYFYFKSSNDEVINFNALFDHHYITENPNFYLDRFSNDELIKIYMNVKNNKESIVKVMESKGFDREDLIFT